MLIVTIYRHGIRRTRWMALCDTARECNAVINDNDILFMVPDIYLSRAYGDFYPLLSSVEHKSAIHATYNGSVVYNVQEFLFSRWVKVLNIQLKGNHFDFNRN